MRKALVTGATRNPGRCIAVALAGAGYQTHAMGLDHSALEQLLSDYGIHPMALDLTDRDAIDVIASGLSPEVIVHAALRWPEGRVLLEYSESDVDMALEVNLSAMMQLSKALLPGMVERKRGAIIVVAPQTPEIWGVLETTVAGAEEAFVRALRNETSGSGITVEYLQPETASDNDLAQAILNVLSEPASG